MATVKGDVHDIGKNIVGVVLQCNNFEVIDLGVMVPATRSSRPRASENADIIGLSGLITPSLEEMAHVAREMQRQGFTIPLLIGGATTSRTHTAVKIEPNYAGPTVWVPDASRAVGVASSLSSPEQREAYMVQVRADFAKVREAHSKKTGQKSIALEAARANAVKIDWSSPSAGEAAPARPHGAQELPAGEDRGVHRLGSLLPGLGPGRALPGHPHRQRGGRGGAQRAREGQAMLERIVKGRWLTANGVFGLWPANSVGDDIEIYADERRDRVLMTWHNLRQQNEKPAGNPNQCLADFVADKDSGIPDYIGAFAVTTGVGIEARLQGIRGEERRLLRDHAEGARRPARRGVRRAPAPSRAHRVLGLRRGREAHQRAARGREVPGHPSRAGVSRRAPTTPRRPTSSGCWRRTATPASRSPNPSRCCPTAAVSGFYLAHPQSRYFAVGKVERDQVADYAHRKGMDLAHAGALARADPQLLRVAAVAR